MNWSKVKFAHCIPGALPVDIHLDDAPFISNVAYKAISPYICMAPGTHHLQIYNHEDVKQPFLDYNIDLIKDKEYTIVITGDIDDPRTPHIRIYEDNKTGTPGLRFIHSANGVQSIDIYNKNTLFLKNLEYDSRSEYYVFGAEPTSIAITASNSTDVVLGPIVLNLKPDEFYTLIITGTYKNNNPLVTLLSNDTSIMCLTL